VNWNAELIWKMRMELAFQWGLVEDEIPDVFRTLLPAVNAQLLYLKSFIQGQFMSFLRRLEDNTNPGQRKGSLTRYLKESISGFKIMNTNPG
jgi:hypothetical protein